MQRRYFQRVKVEIEETKKKAEAEERKRTSWRTRSVKLLKGLVKQLTWVRVAFVLLGLPLIFYVYREVTRDVLIIDPISVPKRFEEAGLTPQVMADRLGERMQEIERSTQTRMKKDVLAARPGETAIPEIEIPGTKLGLRTVVDVARSVFGRHPKHIGGDIVLLDDARTGIEEHRIKRASCRDGLFFAGTGRETVLNG